MIDQSADADLILLPELWNFGWHSMFDRDITRDEVLKCSETIEGETISRIAQKAREVNAYIVSGSILERRGEDFYNTLALLDPRER